MSQSGAAAGHYFFADGATLTEAATGTAPAPAPPAGPGARPAAGPAAFDGGLLANASFEGAIAGWTGYGAVVASVPWPTPPGAYAIRATNTAPLGYFTLNPPSPSVVSTTAGTAYAAEAWVRAASASSVGRPLQLKLRERTPAGPWWPTRPPRLCPSPTPGSASR